MRTGVWCLGLVTLGGCSQVAGLEGYSFDREEEATSPDASVVTGGSGGTGGIGGNGGGGVGGSSGVGGTGGSPAACEGESAQNCGNCGTQTRTCNGGQWSTWTACAGEGVCEANATDGCGDVGARTCSSQCQWGACTCTQASDTQTCGDCGTQSRTCSGGQWSTWSVCPPSCGALEECYSGDLCVAKGVSVTGGYEIDATEVTRSQYEGWLATTPSTSGQPSYCTWNTSYTPTCQWPPGAQGGHPVVCVDWCDAYAYCKGVGKRLCGKIGGGANAYGDYADATKSQWYNACSSGGQNDYPYGDTYDVQACNGYDKGVGTTVPAGSLASCDSVLSGYTGVYDLSGNVLEWEDACGLDYCRLRAGSFFFDDYPRCDNPHFGDRVTGGNYIGFRCCAP